MVIVGMTTARSEGCVSGHHGEIFCRVIVAYEFHGKRGAGIFTVAVIGGGGGMISIGNGALIHIGAEEAM
jgi:pyruvate/2-oxoacid:ferredoxin oxidoreductase beta subunit